MIDIIIDKSGFQKILLKEKLKIYGFLAKLFLKSRINRTYDIVNADYDLGSWNRNIDKIDFDTHYGKTEKNDMVIFTYNGGLFKDTRSRFEKKYNSMLVDILSEYKQESVVELGCGIGIHQFLLYNKGFQKLEGYDLSENAISVNKQYADKKEIPIVFNVHDLNQPFAENMIKNKIIFTHACLEQCHMIMANVLHNILQGKPKIVINFEVDYDSSPLMVKKHFDSRGYQNNLVSHVQEDLRCARSNLIIQINL